MTWANSPPVGFAADVADHRRGALAERSPLGQAFLAVLQGLGGLIRGAGPAQLAVLVDQHQSGPTSLEQLLGGQHDLLQGRRQAPFRVQEPMAPILLVSSVGSIGMAHACLSGCQGLANRSAGQEVGRLGCRAGLQAVIGAPPDRV
jgi:hypothetical protein